MLIINVNLIIAPFLVLYFFREIKQLFELDGLQVLNSAYFYVSIVSAGILILRS